MNDIATPGESRNRGLYRVYAVAVKAAADVLQTDAVQPYEAGESRVYVWDTTTHAYVLDNVVSVDVEAVVERADHRARRDERGQQGDEDDAAATATPYWCIRYRLILVTEELGPRHPLPHIPFPREGQPNLCNFYAPLVQYEPGVVDSTDGVYGQGCGVGDGFQALVGWKRRFAVQSVVWGDATRIYDAEADVVQLGSSVYFRARLRLPQGAWSEYIQTISASTTTDRLYKLAAMTDIVERLALVQSDPRAVTLALRSSLSTLLQLSEKAADHHRDLMSVVEGACLE